MNSRLLWNDKQRRKSNKITSQAKKPSLIASAAEFDSGLFDA